MEVFLAQLVGFAVIVFIMVRYVAPPVKKLMRKQQDEVRQQILDSEAAADRLAQAEEARAKAVEKSKAEAAKIREGARTDALRIADDLQAQSVADAARIRQHGVDQIELQRQATIRKLSAELGQAAATDADRLVREHLSDSEAREASVDRFLDELEAMTGDGSISSGSVSGSGGKS